MSPKGVEHRTDVPLDIDAVFVHPSMSPKGVEHAEVRVGGAYIDCASINVAERR